MDIYEIARIFSKRTGFPVSRIDPFNFDLEVTIPFINKKSFISVTVLDDKISAHLEIGYINESSEVYELMNKMMSKYFYKYYINFMGKLVISTDFIFPDFTDSPLTAMALGLKIMSGPVRDDDYYDMYRSLVTKCY